jgi:hypothetical protein
MEERPWRHLGWSAFSGVAGLLLIKNIAENSDLSILARIALPGIVLALASVTFVIKTYVHRYGARPQVEKVPRKEAAEEIEALQEIVHRMRFPVFLPEESLVPAITLQALLNSWRKDDYTLFLDDINHVLLNPTGNPRWQVIPGVSSIDEVLGIRLVFKNQNPFADVLKAIISLTDKRSISLRIILPIRLDAMDFAMMQHHRQMLTELYKQNKSHVMETFKLRKGSAHTIYGDKLIPVEIGESLEGVSIRMDSSGQWMNADGGYLDTAAIWSSLVRTMTLYSPWEGEMKVQFGLLSHQDFRIQQANGGRPIAVAANGSTQMNTPGLGLVAIDALTQRTKVHSMSQTIWWDQPGAALQAMQDGFLEQLENQSQHRMSESPENLQRIAHAHAREQAVYALAALPRLLKHTDSLLYEWEKWNAKDYKVARKVLRRARPVLEAFIADDGSSGQGPHHWWNSIGLTRRQNSRNVPSSIPHQRRAIAHSIKSAA